MKREDVLALIGDNGLTVYSATTRSSAIDSLAERIMDDDRALAFDLVAEMNRPGMSGELIRWKDHSHGTTEQVPDRAA